MQLKEAIRTYDYTSSDPRQYRLWSSQAQPYASGDQLARCLQEGWQLSDEVKVETLWFGEARRVTIYHIDLYKSDRKVTMRVMGSPFTYELVNDERLGLKQVPHMRTSSGVKFEVVEE